MDGSILVAAVVVIMGYIIWCGQRNAKKEAAEKAAAEAAEAAAEQKDDVA